MHINEQKELQKELKQLTKSPDWIYLSTDRRKVLTLRNRLSLTESLPLSIEARTNLQQELRQLAKTSGWLGDPEVREKIHELRCLLYPAAFTMEDTGSFLSSND